MDNSTWMRTAKVVQDAVTDDPRMLDDQVALAGLIASTIGEGEREAEREGDWADAAALALRPYFTNNIGSAESIGITAATCATIATIIRDAAPPAPPLVRERGDGGPNKRDFFLRSATRIAKVFLHPESVTERAVTSLAAVIEQEFNRPPVQPEEGKEQG